VTETEPPNPERDLSTLYRFRRNVVVAASAGTGKTHALVGVLIHLAMGACENEAGALIDPVPLARIVATTFSRKAAAEIRERLTRELTRLASSDPDATYKPDLLSACDRVGAPRFADGDLAGRAAKALDAISETKIGTLHALAATIVRAGGAARGRAPSFDIEGEEDARERAKRAAAGALEDLFVENREGAASLAHLAGGVGNLIDRGGELLGRLGEDGKAASELVIETHDAAEIEKTFEAFLAHARLLRDDSLLGASATALSDAWDLGSPDVERAACDLCGVAARGRLTESARAFFEFRASLPGTTHGERGRNLLKLWRLRHRVVPEAELLKAWLVRAEERLRHSMAFDSVLGYGEVLREARETLSGDWSASRDLDAFLVDEFQDTSRVQREIVELLWKGEDPDARLPRIARVRRRGLLVVGDRKQSIYGFRGADVGSFAELCVGLAGRPARDALRIPPGRVWEPEEPIADFVALRVNRRSRPEILEFVNAYSKERLRAFAQPAELYEVEYAPAIEDLSGPREAARTSTGELDGARAEGGHVSWIRVPIGPGITSSRADEAEAVARRIARVLSEGRPKVRGLPPAPMDIAVLGQRNGMLEAVAYALGRLGIPYVVAGGGFFSAGEVKDMVAMLSFIVDPGDVISRATVLRGVWCGVTDETLILLTDPGVGLSDIGGWEVGERRRYVHAEDRARLLALRDVVQRLRTASIALGPAETLRQAVRSLSLEETLVLLPRGEQRIANVRKTIALAEREPNAWAFLARMERAMDEERAEPEAAIFSESENAVRLLTVHASKGLDFPIVILPEAGASGGSVERSPIAVIHGARADLASRIAARLRDDEGRLHDTPSFAAWRRENARRDLAERARLAYVAVTRAKEAICFVGDRRPPKGAASDALGSSTAAALGRMVTDPAASTLFHVDDSVTLPLLETAPIKDGRFGRSYQPLDTPQSEGKGLTAPELEDFSVCRRRFQLKHLLRVPEPIASGEATKPRPRQLTLVEAANKATAAARAATARWTSAYERVPLPTCVSIACGYVGLCHPEAHAKARSTS
jgi:ATP-dependent helicase/nuclease subunit A